MCEEGRGMVCSVVRSEVYSRGELVGTFSPRDDLPRVRQGLLNLLKRAEIGSKFRIYCLEVLDNNYGDAWDSTVDGLLDDLGL